MFHFPVDAGLHINELQCFCVPWGRLNLQLDSCEVSAVVTWFHLLGSTVIVIVVVVEGAIDMVL